MPITPRFAAILMTVAAIHPVTASAEPIAMPLTYEQFEASVPHIDLETCPGRMVQDNVFCRASINHEQIHVFAFSYEGESPLVGFASFDLDGIAALLK